MSRACDICGKASLAGHRIVRRGQPKKQGGAGSRILNRAKRRQLPNLQTVKAVVQGRSRKLRLCTKCLKAGKVTLKR